MPATAIPTTVSISIPTPLRAYTGGRRAIEAEGGTVAEVLADAALRHPELSRHIFSEAGGLRGFVNLYLGDENVR
ncbi:MAG TPA: hypothetical protein VNP72_06200, partial [Longimicrobium sp.]|nr:hypothetical protein [Longimicrobium sp.]